MKKFHFQIKITGKKSKQLILKKQSDLAIASTGDEMNQPTYPEVVNELLEELAEIKNKK